jgi:hypothetical protein
MPGPVVKIDLRKLDELIARKGVNLAWYRTRRCPCAADDAYLGHADPACPACDGLGWLRGEPTYIRALFTSHAPRKTPEPSGTVEAGSRQVTPPRWVRLAEGDWLAMTQYPVRTSEVLTYGAARGQGDRLAALRPKQVLSVQSLRSGNVFEFPQASYTAPDGATVNDQGAILWQPGAPVRPGEKLSVEYLHLEVYQVYRGDMPMQRGAEDKRLPDRANARLITRKKLLEQSHG